MSSALETLDAVVLRSTPFGEADLIVTILARGKGKRSAFARGARRSTRRFGGALQPLVRVRLEAVERRNSDWLDLRGGVVDQPFLGIRDDLDRLAHAGYAAELVRELLEEKVLADPLLDLLLSFFELLSTSPASSLSLRAFEIAALSQSGYAPVLSHCARCGVSARQIEHPHFDSTAGGLCCRNCASRWAQTLPPPALALMQALAQGGLEGAAGVEEAKLPVDVVTRILRVFIREHVPRDLRSLSFMTEVGAPP